MMVSMMRLINVAPAAVGDECGGSRAILLARRTGEA